MEPEQSIDVNSAIDRFNLSGLRVSAADERWMHQCVLACEHLARGRVCEVLQTKDHVSFRFPPREASMAFNVESRLAYFYRPCPNVAFGRSGVRFGSMLPADAAAEVFRLQTTTDVWSGALADQVSGSKVTLDALPPKMKYGDAYLDKLFGA